MRLPITIALIGALGLAACGERDITLRDFRMNRSSPEEFSILPGKPLQVPESLAALPQPTPGQGNLTDPTPLDDAIIALGGTPNAGVGSDGALVNHAGRFGTDPAIRQDLAAADLEFRKRKSLFTWQIVPRDDYAEAYRREALDPYVELDRFRRAGVRTPSAPPSGR